MLRDLLLVLNMLVCIVLIGVVLLQRSEGGAFGTGGSPTGLVTARGAGDLLTRTTWVLFTMFLALSLALTLLGGRERSSQAIIERLKNTTVNPDLLSRPTPPPGAASGATAPLGAPATGQSPVQSSPGGLVLPPLTSAPVAGASAAKPHVAHAAPRHAAAAPAAPAEPSTPPPTNLATPAPLTLPPIEAPSSAPPKTPPS